MAERKPLSKKIRFEVFKRDKFTCQYCGRMSPDVILEVDHMKPIAKGGDNSLINLITACKDCNRGKRDKEITDDSAVKKQQAQLKELAERKEQLTMILKWRDGLKEIENDSVKAIEQLFVDKTGKTLTESGHKCIKKWLKEFSFIEILNATEIAIDNYYNGSKNSLEYAFNKISGICFNTRRQKDNPSFYYANYIVKALRGKNYYFDESVVRTYVQRNIVNEDNFEDAKTAIIASKNYDSFVYMCEHVIGGVFGR